MVPFRVTTDQPWKGRLAETESTERKFKKMLPTDSKWSERAKSRWERL